MAEEDGLEAGSQHRDVDVQKHGRS